MNEIDTGKDGDRIEGLERLARTRAPERDLWPGISARLAPRRRSRYPLFQLALAASLVTGLASVFTLSLRGSPSADAPSAPLALSNDSRAIVQANLSIVEHSERQLRQALKKQPNSQPLLSLLESTQHHARDLRAML